MKDSEAGPPYGCRLEQVELGRDNDGDPITSCVAVPEQLPEAKAESKGPKLKGNTKLAYDNFLDILKQHPQPECDGHRVCSAIEWRQRFYDTYPGKPDTKQKAFVRAVLKLQELKIIIFSSDKVCLLND
jgi:hypothetical protein